jgi:hypothetical protein
VNPLAPPDDVPDWSRLDLRGRDALAAVAQAGLTVRDAFDVQFAVAYADREAAITAQLPAGPMQAAIRHSGVDAVRAAFSALLRGPGARARQRGHHAWLRVRARGPMTIRTRPKGISVEVQARTRLGRTNLQAGSATPGLPASGSPVGRSPATSPRATRGCGRSRGAGGDAPGSGRPLITESHALVGAALP